MVPHLVFAVKSSSVFALPNTIDDGGSSRNDAVECVVHCDIDERSISGTFRAVRRVRAIIVHR